MPSWHPASSTAILVEHFMPEISENSDILLDFLIQSYPFSCYSEQTLVRKVKGTITLCEERDWKLRESLLKQHKPEVFAPTVTALSGESGCSDVNRDWIQVELAKSLLTWRTMEVVFIMSWGSRLKPWTPTVMRRCSFICFWLALNTSENKVCAIKDSRFYK